MPTGPQGRQVLAVVEAARGQIEVLGAQVRVLVVGPALDEEVRAVLRRARRAILPNEVPPGGTHALPPQYLLLKSLSIDGDRATVTATLGPVPAPREGIVLLSCGTTFNISVSRVADRWIAKVTSLVVC